MTEILSYAAFTNDPDGGKPAGVARERVVSERQLTTGSRCEAATSKAE